MPQKYDYDAIIIGAGIGGLVCGCYLAKTGMKTLIVEKNAKPGGYCTSFTRQGFHFDACVHSLGSLREEGNLRKILRDLDLENRLVIFRANPQDIIHTPEGEIKFWNNKQKTINELRKRFPKEVINIEKFFNFIEDCDGLKFKSLTGITFKTLLDKYFRSNKLKGILSIPVLGNAGLPASKISAFMAVTVYKEFILDGGYYPKGGMQIFPNILLQRFKELNGEVKLNSFVSKIEVVKNFVEGVEIDKKFFVSSKCVVSAVDAMQTFLSLIGKNILEKRLLNNLEQLKPSLSTLLIYLGTNKNLNNISVNSNMWLMQDYDVERNYCSLIKGNIFQRGCFLIRKLFDEKSVIVSVNISSRNKQDWGNKDKLSDLVINKIQGFVPNFDKYVVYKEVATAET